MKSRITGISLAGGTLFSPFYKKGSGCFISSKIDEEDGADPGNHINHLLTSQKNRIKVALKSG